MRGRTTAGVVFGGIVRLVRAAFLFVLRLVRRIYLAAGALLSVGLVLALLALRGLAGLTEEVLEGDTLGAESRFMLWLDAHGSPALDRVALDATVLGSSVVVITIAAVAITLLVLVGRRMYAEMIGAAVTGALVISPVLKTLFGRPRPRLFEWRVDYAGLASYPSGHATLAAILFVTLAYVVHRLADGRRALSVSAALLAAFLCFAVGLSRIYLGVHYPTDVLAGYAVGFIWSVFVIVVVEVLHGRGGRGVPVGERTGGTNR